jgi:hypothetical protein
MTIVITGEAAKRQAQRKQGRQTIAQMIATAMITGGGRLDSTAVEAQAAVPPVIVEPEPPDPTPEDASAAPTASTENVLNFQNSNNRMQGSGVVYPAGDWSLGMWCRIDTSGTMYDSGPSTNPYTSNNSMVIYTTVNSITVVGKDNAGNVLAVSAAATANTGSRGISSRFTLPVGRPLFICVVKVGTLVQLWIRWPGHAAVKVGEETTTFGVTTAQAAWFGYDRGSSFRWRGAIRAPFMVSFSLTEAQLNAVSDGTSPLTYGTPQTSDFYFPTTTTIVPPSTTASNWVNAVPGGANATPFLTGYSTTAGGLGNAPLTDGVYIKPDQPGRVFQAAPNGKATITLSGTYKGTAAPIQVLPVDWATGVSVGVWTTVAPTPSGGTWSGNITLRARAGWYKFQTRKLVDGVPSTQVMTSDSRVGIGEVVMLLGQSLMEAMMQVASGNNDVTANGLWSFSRAALPLVNGIGQEYVNVTGAVNDGTGKVKLTTQYPHSRRTGSRVRVVGVTGTVEANAEWIVTVTANNQLVLDGSTFTNAYVSGGLLYFVQPQIQVADNANQTVYGGQAVIGNYLSSQLGCPVQIINRSVGAMAIEAFSSYTYSGGVGGRGTLAVLHAKHAEKIGSVLWLHGQANIGASNYSSSGGSSGAYTGWGLLGDLFDFLTAQFPNNDFHFGVAAFSQTGGIVSALSANSVHEYRHGMYDWTERKRQSGETRVFFLGWFNDLQPMWENAVPLNSHMSPPFYKRFAARMAHSLAYHLGKVSADAAGPRIVSASRNNAVVTLSVQHNGGTSLRVGRDGALPSGFEVSADNFANLLPISNIEIPSPTTIRITLASNPGTAVKVRYQFGYVGNYSAGTYFTPRVTGAANNGSGAIRLTFGTTGLTPSGSQAVGGHGMSENSWGMIQEVNGTTEANGIWQFHVVDASNLDLIGSTFVNAFAAGGLYGGSTTGTLVRELGVPIYDNRTIGGHDTAGAPLAPTYQPLLAA